MLISRNYRTDIYIGMLSGTVLYFLLVTSSYIALLNISAHIEIAMLNACYVVSCLICTLAVLYRNNGIFDSFFRSSVIIITIILGFTISVQLGLFKNLDHFLEIERDSENMGSGLYMAYFLYLDFIFISVAIVFATIWKAVKTKLSKFFYRKD